LRRRALEQGKPALLVGGDVAIDLLRRRVQRHGQVVRLALKSYEVLRVLAESPGKVLTHSQILGAVWGNRRVARVEYLRIAIQDLRNKLEPDPARPVYILTERGIGYRLNMQTRQSGILPVMPEQMAP
jgi:two-component system, OmpR family, KDP operon response regulator KdpE